MNLRANNRVLSLRFLGVLVCLMMMSACTFHNPAPIVDHSGGSSSVSQDPTGTYRVRPGDTLFGIAFSYGMDQRDLAAWNNISEPYTIYPEQLLRLTEPSNRSSASSDVKIYKASTPQATSTRTYTTRDVPATGATQKPVPPAVDASSPTTPARSTTVPVARTTVPATQKPVPAGTTAPKPVVASTDKPAVQPAAKATPPPAAKAVAKPPVTTPHADPSSWLWPTTGRVLRGFVAGDPARNGLDIAGTEGQPIQATAAGTVVYSGNGLIGYGELIIIKHSDNMLSAYAHNKVRLANEGQQVAAGEKIAEMGRNDRNEQILHFEIRTRGKPVNPLTYLPKK